MPALSGAGNCLRIAMSPIIHCQRRLVQRDLPILSLPINDGDQLCSRLYGTTAMNFARTPSANPLCHHLGPPQLREHVSRVSPLVSHTVSKLAIDRDIELQCGVLNADFLPSLAVYNFFMLILNENFRHIRI